MTEVAIWWYCPKCDSENDPDTWRIPVYGGPIVREDGKAFCPDCLGDLVPAPPRLGAA
jgi:hypothetical protein